MYKTFYASGFLFHEPSQQILLQQKQSISPASLSWILFEKQHVEKEDPADVFRNSLLKILNIDIKSLNKIYSYTKDGTKACSLFYANVNKLVEFSKKNDYIFRWFSFKEVLKIKADEQTKHDIVIGQRVVEAVIRKELGEKTL